MHFDLVDRVLDLSPERAVTIKHVSMAEEYLLDHFPGFPVLPGVMMIEALVQAARRVAGAAGVRDADRLVLSGVRALKYGKFVRPGETLRCAVELTGPPAVELAAGGGEGVGLGGGGGGGGGDWALEFRGEGRALPPGFGGASDEAPVAVAGKFTLRRLRLA